MIFLLISSGLCLLLLTVWHTTRNRHLPPGPMNLPMLGYLPWLNKKKPYETLTELSCKYGPIFGLRLGSLYTVVLSDAKLIRQAFSKNVFTGRAPLYVTHGIMKGYGIVCAEGELWKDQRKFLSVWLKNLGMSKSGIKRFKLESWITDEVREFLQLIDEQLSLNGSSSLDPMRFLHHCLGNVMNIIVFGKKYSLDDPVWLWLQKVQEEGTQLIGVSAVLNFLPILRYIPSMRKPLDYLIEGKHRSHKIYSEIINTFESQKYEHEAEPTLHTGHLIDAFLEERNLRRQNPEPNNANLLCDQQFFHLLADIFGAGVDTTLSTLRWLLLFVAKHQNVQQKLQQDLDLVLKPENRAPNLSDLEQLPFFEATIAETQRIRSVVPVGIPHGALETVQFNNYCIPAGTMIIPLQWAVHMDPKVWPAPNEFQPERFIDSEGKFFKPETFIPFQTGKRMCIGEELGRMLLFLFSAAILSQYQISVDENASDVNMDGICGITLMPSHYKLVFKHRF